MGKGGRGDGGGRGREAGWATVGGSLMFTFGVEELSGS